MVELVVVIFNDDSFSNKLNLTLNVVTFLATLLVHLDGQSGLEKVPKCEPSIYRLVSFSS